jgi:hypothetical protein
MADEKIRLTLPVETRKALEDMQTRLEGINNAMASLKKIGIDVSGLENQLEVARKAREILLTEFK